VPFGVYLLTLCSSTQLELLLGLKLAAEITYAFQDVNVCYWEVEYCLEAAWYSVELAEYWKDVICDNILHCYFCPREPPRFA
jgi:hypothetical protein